MIGVLIGGSVVVAGGLAFAGFVVGTYNGLIHAKQDIKEMWSNIKTEYQRRVDLFVNLVESVKSIKKHEKNTLVEVIKMRNGLKRDGNQKKEMEVMKRISAMLPDINILVERYPEIKAGNQHTKLMGDIKETEDRINVARTNYNEEVREYNVMVLEFPRNIVANWFKFKEEFYFECEEEAKKSPKIVL